MLKRVVSLSVGLCMLFGMSAFAAAPTSSTTTTYNTSTNKIHVRTIVDNLDKGSTVTYLAFKNEGNDVTTLQGNEISYIDQVKLQGDTTSYTFDFDTADSNIDSRVMVGGTTLGTPVNNTVPGVVIVKFSNGDDIKATGTIVSENILGENDLVKVTLDRAINIGNLLSVSTSGVNMNDVAFFVGSSNSFWISNSAIDKTKATTITFKEENPNGLILGLNDTTNTDAAPEGTSASVSAYAQVVGTPIEYGIAFTKKAPTPDQRVAWDAAGADLDSVWVCYPALGKNSEGQFVVQLASEGSDPAFGVNDTLYACTYYKGSDGTYKFFDDVTSVTIKIN